MINKIFYSNNIDILKQIDDDHINLIYSDILYGTGKDFKQFKDIKATKQNIENFYYPILIEMKRILKDTGNIVLQMDKRINHWIRILLDEIFEYNNFQNEITWCYSGGGTTNKKFSPKSDVIIWYSKSKNYYFKPQFIPYTGIQKAHPYSKNREEKSLRGKHLEDWWIDINSFGGSTNHPEKKQFKYPTQKPEKLMYRIIDSFSKENDIVADFFMGSGTFIKVAKENNRNFIGCDNSLEAYNITKKRINYD